MAPRQSRRNVKMDIKSKIQEIEAMSRPIFVNGYLIPRKFSETVNGKKILADSKMNRGRSGKGFTTLWYVDGVRVSKANLIACIGG